MQFRFREDVYPIGRLILDRAQRLGLSRTDLVRRLRYRRIGKGHRALANLMTTGAILPQIEAHLADALEIDAALLNAALDATVRQRRDEAAVQNLKREAAQRAAFKPHLRVETARTRLEPLFIAALLTTARLRAVPTPDETWSASPDERDRILKRAIREHFDRQRGWVPAFGAIVSYTLVTMAGYRVDFGYPYDVDGNPAGPMQPVERLGEAVLGTKRADTRLTGLFNNEPIR